MKKIFYLLAVPSLFMLHSCGGGDEHPKDDENDTKKVDSVATNNINLSELREFDMSPYELNAIIYIPIKYHKEEGDDADWFNEPEIIHNDGEAKWEITVPGDKHFHMVIEDWGDEERTVAMEKTEHEDQKDIFDFNYEEEGSNYLLYSRTLKTNNTTIDDKNAQAGPNYHFFCVQKIDGSYVVFRSFEMGDFRKVTAKQMLSSAMASKTWNSSKWRC